MEADTRTLLDGLAAYFRRFIILTDEQLYALVAWTAHTYVYEIADTTPYLIVTSAEKRSGKTRVIEAVQHVAHRPQTVAALTGPVLFRLIAQEKPTLLIDETDTIFHDGRGGPSERQEELRAVLNAGYRRGTKIPRMLPSMEIARFEVYGPKLLAGIGHLPETIEDRGLSIRLSRKRPEDNVERFRFRDVRNGSTEALRKGLRDWSAGARLALEGVYPEMPDGLDDRAQDSYEILIALGDMAGEEWSLRIRDAMVILRSSHDTERQESQGLRLLRDVQTFSDRLQAFDWIETSTFLALLYEEGEQPWEEWWKGKEGSEKKAARRLAMLLAEYGVQPGRNPERTKRGYEVTPILEAVERYVGHAPAQTRPNTSDTSELAWIEGSGLDELEDAGRVEHVREEVSRPVAGTHGYAVSDVLDVLDVSEREGAPRGSTEWIGQASMDELRDFYRDS